MKFLLSVFLVLFIPSMAFSYNETKVFQKIEKDLDSIIVKDLNSKKTKESRSSCFA